MKRKRNSFPPVLGPVSRTRRPGWSLVLFSARRHKVTPSGDTPGDILA